MTYNNLKNNRKKKIKKQIYFYKLEEILIKLKFLTENKLEILKLELEEQEHFLGKIDFDYNIYSHSIMIEEKILKLSLEEVFGEKIGNIMFNNIIE